MGGITATTGVSLGKTALAIAQQTTVDLISSTKQFPVGTVVSTGGYLESGDGGGAQWKLTAVTGQTPNQSPAQLGDALLNDASGSQWALVIDGDFSVLALGAVLNQISTAAIQAGINESVTGGVATLPKGTLLLGPSGNLIGGRPYALILPSNSSLKGPKGSILKADDSTNMEILTTNRGVAVTNLFLDGFKIDGNSDNRVSGDISLWLANVTDLTIGEVEVLNSSGFGMRFTLVDQMTFDSLKVNNKSLNPGTDAIHFFDCSNVTGNKVDAESAGDDCFIITADTTDTHDITIGQVLCKAPLGNRGVLLNLSDAADTATQQHAIFNITLNGVITNDCAGPAVLMTKAEFTNINIEISDKGSEKAFGVEVGSANVAGFIVASSFKINSTENTKDAVFVQIIDGFTHSNKIEYNGVHTTDGFSGVTLAGARWSGSININHNPNNAKVNALNAVDLFCNDSQLSITSNGGDRNLKIRGGANNNAITLGSLSSADSFSIDVSGAPSGTTIIGGSLGGGSINGDAALVRFSNVIGATRRTKANLTPNASGIATINHGLVGAPSFHSVVYFGASDINVNITAASATTLTVRFRDSSGTLVTTGTHAVKWEATI